ncbi:MAG TPA: hypothetical protein PK095_15775, partial [Myxococcota bacterium]|nr:hypothetical protein [Myxococcota bacterium]
GLANFRALYAVFEAPRMIEVRHASSEVGTVDANFLAALQEDGDLGAFGARAGWGGDEPEHVADV